MGLAFIPLYIKYLGIESYGLIGLFTVLQTWLSLLDMGMTPTLGREMARFTGGSHSNESIRNLLRSIELIAVGIAAAIAGGVTLGSEWIATSWLQAESLPLSVVSQAFAIMGIVIAIRFIEGIYRSAIIGLQRQVLFNVVNSIMATLRWGGAVLILIWVSSTIEAFFIWQGIVSFFTAIFLAVITYRSLPRRKHVGRFSFLVLRTIWRFAGGMMGITLLTLLLTQMDKILLSKLLTLSNYGYYALAAAISGVLFMLAVPVTQAFYPRFCELNASNNKLAMIESYHKGAQLISVISGSVAIVVACFSETLLTLWTNDAGLANHVAPLLTLLMIGNLLNVLMYIPSQAQIAYGWTSLTIIVNTIAVLFFIPAILWVVPRYGAIGAAWLWIIINIGYLLIAVQFMYRRILLKEKFRWYIKDVLIPLASIFFVVGLVKLIFPDPETLLSQLVVIAIAIIISLLVGGLSSKYIREQLLWLTKRYLIKQGINPLSR